MNLKIRANLQEQDYKWSLILSFSHLKWLLLGGQGDQGINFDMSSKRYSTRFQSVSLLESEAPQKVRLPSKKEREQVKDFFESLVPISKVGVFAPY